MRVGTPWLDEAAKERCISSVAVITTVKFNDFMAFGKTPCQTDSAHGGFCSGIDKAYHFHRRHMFDDKPGDFDFRLGGGAETDA